MHVVAINTDMETFALQRSVSLRSSLTVKDSDFAKRYRLPQTPTKHRPSKVCTAFVGLGLTHHHLSQLHSLDDLHVLSLGNIC